MPLDIALRARRARLLQTMQEAGGGVAIIPTAPERIRNRDTHHGYRFDSYFYYLSGFREPEAVLVLIAGDTPKEPAVLPQQGHRARDLGQVLSRV